MLDEFREDSVEPLRRPGAASGASAYGGQEPQRDASCQLQEPIPMWEHWGPSIMTESITPCFRGGFLYRLYDDVTRTWYFYNDTFTFEMHTSCTFEKGVPVEPLNPRVSLEELASGERKCSVVIYPMETIELVRAPRGRNRAQFDGKPLSKEYLARELEEATLEIENGERILAQHTQSTSSEEVLRVCKERGIAFLDPEFPPKSVSFEQCVSSLSTPSSTATSMSLPAPLKPSAWRRPEHYLPLRWREQVRLFRNAIGPSTVQRGELGDSWVISAIAALSENPKYVRDMFRHPVHARETAVEESVGARRVLLNKDGLWHSIVVDTYLPMKGKQQRFARCAGDFCEMWVSYLEKAYAKRNNSYGNIVSGDPLFALRDFTGFPTTRLDARFRACRNDEEASADLFARLAADCENGHRVLLSTPLSGESTMTTAELKEQGLLVGYAYTVVGMVHVTPLIRLLKVRNPWTSCTEWKGSWRVGSPQWERCPEAAAALPVHDGSDSTMVISWEEVMRYFVGCGVVFNHFDYADYRIPSRFIGLHAQLCLEVTVTEPTQLTFILSQEDRRTRQDHDATEYAPLVLSVAAALPSEDPATKPPASIPGAPSNIVAPSEPMAGGMDVRLGALPLRMNGGMRCGLRGESQRSARLTVVANSTADTEHPTSGLVFLQGRDVSIMHTFYPDQSPYLVVPRRLVREGDPDELPFVLGVLSQLPFTAFGQAQVRLRVLPVSSAFHHGGEAFANETEEVRTEVHIRRTPAVLTTMVTSQLNPEE